MPKDKGAAAFVAALIVKALVKHGWPSVALGVSGDAWAFKIVHHFEGLDAAPEYWAAVETAARIVARAYRVQIEVEGGRVVLLHRYRVTPRGTLERI